LWRGAPVRRAARLIRKLAAFVEGPSFSPATQWRGRRTPLSPLLPARRNLTLFSNGLLAERRLVFVGWEKTTTSEVAVTWEKVILLIVIAVVAFVEMFFLMR
jgi:hypothetical protein